LLVVPVLDVLLPVLGFVAPGDAFMLAPVVDFMLAPVVVDELVEVGCLVCLYVFADAAKGEPASPAMTSAAIVSLLFIIRWNSWLDHTGGNCCWPMQFQKRCECLITKIVRMLPRVSV
jgi:hypothetical protein